MKSHQNLDLPISRHLESNAFSNASVFQGESATDFNFDDNKILFRRGGLRMQNKQAASYTEASGAIRYNMTNNYMFRYILQKNKKVLKGL